MKVETFEIEQSSSEATSLAQDGAALELVEMLGLTGQKKLIHPETATRIPYRAMEKQEQLVYGALLTEKSTLEDYDADTIPLRVLQVAAHAKQCGLFKKIEIWYATPAGYKDDPILVGYVETEPYTFRLYILARWGKSLQTLEQMEAIAVDHARKAAVNAINEIKSQLERRMDQVMATTDLATLSRKLSYYDMEP